MIKSIMAVLALGLSYSSLLEAKTWKIHIFSHLTEEEVSDGSPWVNVFSKYSIREIADQFNSKLREDFLNTDFNDFLAFKNIYSTPSYIRHLPKNTAKFIQDENSRNKFEYEELLKITASLEMYFESLKVNADNPTDMSILRRSDIIRLNAEMEDKVKRFKTTYKDSNSLGSYAIFLAERIVEKSKIAIEQQKEKVNKLIDNFNRVSFSLAEYILTSATLEESINRKIKLAKLLTVFIEDANFEGAQIVSAVLNMAPVDRLGWGQKNFWFNIKRKSVLEKYNESAEILSSEKNYRRYYERLRELETSGDYNIIPITGIMLRNLEFIDQNSDFLVNNDGLKMLNIDKQQMIIRGHREYRNRQRAVKEKADYVASLTIFEDAFEYDLSTLKQEKRDEHFYKLSYALKASGLKTAD